MTRLERLKEHLRRLEKIRGLTDAEIVDVGREIEIEKGRGAPPPKPAGPSAMLCEHANEVPSVCRCFEDCYCRRVGSCSKPGAFPLKVPPKPKAPRARRR